MMIGGSAIMEANQDSSQQITFSLMTNVYCNDLKERYTEKAFDIAIETRSRFSSSGRHTVGSGG